MRQPVCGDQTRSACAAVGRSQARQVKKHAGLMTSLATSGLKRLVGYIDGDCYYPGRIRLDV